jgi:sulfite exporter TauE/SafE
MWRNAIEGFTIGTVMLLVGLGILWLIKTLIEHRRWSRLSKIQNDVHNKLLDRFTNNEELLAYIQTPAGKRFLESTPIPLESPRAINAPVGRILGSAQAGAVLTVLGLGVTIVSQNTLEEVASPLAAFGVVIIALGLGFVVSAALAYALTRRFGLLNDPNATPEARG